MNCFFLDVNHGKNIVNFWLTMREFKVDSAVSVISVTLRMKKHPARKRLVKLLPFARGGACTQIAG